MDAELTPGLDAGVARAVEAATQLLELFTAGDPEDAASVLIRAHDEPPSARRALRDAAVTSQRAGELHRFAVELDRLNDSILQVVESHRSYAVAETIPQGDRLAQTSC